jgi:uncharacterized protein YcbK (DUF882 family)
MFGRRDFLRATGALMAAVTATPALADIAGPALSGSRSLSFLGLHTGELVKVDYWENGNYVPEALSTINYVLRDFRNNEVHVIEPKLLDLLHALQTKLDSRAAFQVISGYRSPATNAMLHERSAGVAAHSLHMQGMAIDIRLPDRAIADLRSAAAGLSLGGVGFYPDSGFVHVDIGPVRYW